jgi:N-acetylglutamate synthase-like GNAT family acetyltransferase
MDVRPYLPADREACLKIFDSQALPLETRTQFERFLEQPEGTYLVMEHDGALVGCGGFELAPEHRLATLVWGMVRRDCQKQGLGRFLLMYRLREIGKSAGIDRVRIETPQPSAAFFEGQGFKVAGSKNGRVEMLKKLTVCA